MTSLRQVYRCNICGNIVVVLHEGKGQLVCCGQPMELLAEKTEGKGKEKHVPVLKEVDEGIRVKVGSIEHPMEEKHLIEWIEVYGDNEIHIKLLKPEEKPEAIFPIKNVKEVRAYCNLHGLWKTQYE